MYEFQSGKRFAPKRFASECLLKFAARAPPAASGSLEAWKEGQVAALQRARWMVQSLDFNGALTTVPGTAGIKKREQCN